jgi:hypothetical protein
MLQSKALWFVGLEVESKIINFQTNWRIFNMPWMIESLSV